MRYSIEKKDLWEVMTFAAIASGETGKSVSSSDRDFFDQNAVIPHPANLLMAWKVDKKFITPGR